MESAARHDEGGGLKRVPIYAELPPRRIKVGREWLNWPQPAQHVATAVIGETEQKPEPDWVAAGEWITRRLRERGK